MTIKISIRQHRPEDLYAHLNKSMGNLSMVVKNGYAHITFHKKVHEQETMKKLQGTEFMRKRLFFKRTVNESGNEMEDENFEIPENQQGGFMPKNDIEEKIHSKKEQLIKKIQLLFPQTLQTCGQKVRRVNERFKSTSREKEMEVLLKTIEQKLQSIENNYDNNMKNFFKYIRNFKSEPDQIDLEPIFKENMSFNFAQININSVNFECTNQYKSIEAYPVKRLCPLNNREFIVSSSISKGDSRTGSVRFYNSDIEEFRENFMVNDGAYGINVSNNIVFVGSYNNSINYINLSDGNLKVQNSGILQGFSKLQSLIYEIKVLPNVSETFLPILSMDQFVRIYSVTNDEIIEGMFSLSFEKTWDFRCQPKTLAIETVNENEILVGSTQKIKKINIEKNRVQEINTSGDIWKIKKFSNNEPLIACTATKGVEIIDIRENRIVQKFTSFDKEIKCFETIPNHTIVYGSNKQIGVLDSRNPSSILWSDSAFHLAPIIDIIKLEEKIISGDMKGGIYSWEHRRI